MDHIAKIAFIPAWSQGPKCWQKRPLLVALRQGTLEGFHLVWSQVMKIKTSTGRQKYEKLSLRVVAGSFYSVG